MLRKQFELTSHSASRVCCLLLLVVVAQRGDGVGEFGCTGMVSVTFWSVMLRVGLLFTMQHLEITRSSCSRCWRNERTYIAAQGLFGCRLTIKPEEREKTCGGGCIFVYKFIYTWQFFVTFLGLLSDPFRKK